METVFAGSIEVQVLRNGAEVARVVRPLRKTTAGPVVRYKRRLWRVRNNSINISGLPLNEADESTPEVDDSRAPGMMPVSAPRERGQTINAPVLAAEPPYVADITSTDDGQDIIIGAGCDERLLVDAGPGTGKTHTACLKVVALIRDHDLPASRIWMISFTRTAVHEIRSRLTTLLEDPSDAASVRIVTLDSLAWTIHSGFSKDAVLTGSYDDNIAQTLAKVRDNPDVREEFEKIRHVVIDEAQDIVGVRAELVLAIVDAVGADCGVTVFADQAQAIYGFTEDDTGADTPRIQLLGALEGRDFRSVSLTEIHRTDSPALLKIFKDVRSKVLDNEAPAATRGAEIRIEIERLADANVGSATQLKLAALPSNGLVLMRQRSDVLLASSFNQDTPHRLRMSGLPIRMLPWPALLLWDHVDRRLTRSVFDRLWWERMAGASGSSAADAAWRLLFETAGESANVIDLHRLRAVLGRSNPPAPFTSPEYGDAGPIIGTIHASKGREAEEVCLYLPPVPDETVDESDADEEVRVMFVGATRARRKLSVGNTSGRRLGNVEGRFWKKGPKGRLQVEIGRLHDIDARGLAGRSTFKAADDVLKAQKFISQKPVMARLFASAKADLGWNFSLETPDGLRIGALSEKVKADLREIAKRCEAWPPPSYLPHIRSLGLRSLALRADDAAIDQLHEPWRTSGFLLAPMLIGVCMTKLQA
jgi:hypothetical protein